MNCSSQKTLRCLANVCLDAINLSGIHQQENMKNIRLYSDINYCMVGSIFAHEIFLNI